MDRSQLKKWGIVIGGILCIVIPIATFSGGTQFDEYTGGYFYFHYSIYVAWALLVVATILFFAKWIFERQKQILKRLSILFLVLAIVYSVVFFSAVVIGNVDNREKLKDVHEMFSTENVILPNKDFKIDEKWSETGLPVALGNIALYNEEIDYESVDGTATAHLVGYYYKGYPKFIRNKILRNTDELYFLGDTTEGTKGEYKYKYDYHSKSNERTDGFSTYFSVRIENEDTIVLVDVRLYHDTNILWDIQGTVDNLIASVSKLPA